MMTEETRLSLSTNNFLDNVTSILDNYKSPSNSNQFILDNVNEDVQQAFHRLASVMINYQQFGTLSVDESYFTDKYCQLIANIYDLGSFRYPIDHFYYNIPRTFPNLSKLYKNVLPISIKLLRDHYRSQDTNKHIGDHQHYCEAVKNRLFIQLLNDAMNVKDQLNEINSDNLNTDDKKKLDTVNNYLELLVYALYPIKELSYSTLEDNNKDTYNKARAYLQDIGKAFNPVKVGKQRDVPFLYQIIVCLVYDEIRNEFRQAKSMRGNDKIRFLQASLAGHMSIIDDGDLNSEAYKNAKKIIIKSLGLNVKELNNILTNRNREHIINKLESLVESMKNIEPITLKVNR